MTVLRPTILRAAPAAVLASIVLLTALRLPAQTSPAAAQATTAPPAPTAEQLAIQAAAKKEHQREMDVLGIKELRPGVDGNPKSPHAANYDEAKADVYPNLPDPLVLKDGKRVTSAKVWWTKRRPEIAELFDENILGKVPVNTPKVNWEVISTKQEKNGDFSVVTKELRGHVDNSIDPAIKVDIELTLTTPANATGPVPVIVELGLSKEFMAMLAKRFPQFAQMAGQGPTWQQQVLAKGWGYAEYIPTSVQADNGAGLNEGIIGLMNKGQPRKMDDWGALRAWAWGASKCLDYFETDKAVDAKQVGIEGHSRYGKATLVAMAYDSRFAIAYVSSSGEAGAKLYRHIFGEQVGNIASDEFYWMAGNFMRYDGPLTTGDLPVDNHELIAMCAPRPVFISGGAIKPGGAVMEDDAWVDAKGMFLAAVGAGPVYKLLGKRDLGTTEFPPMGTPLIDGDIAFRQHSAGHTPAPNWPTFIKFASRYLHAPTASANGDPSASGAPVHMTAAEDRQHMLDLLGIKESEMRPTASSDPKAPNATNYDEAKASQYPNLPDPLTLKNGDKVTTARAWWSERRPEIVADYEREVLGRAPANLPRVTWEVVSRTEETVGDTPVVIRRLAGHVDNSIDPQITVTIDAVLTTPAHAAGPVPVIMELAFAREYEGYLKKEPQVTWSGPGGLRPGDGGVPWQQQVLARGWGYAILNPASFQADDGAGLTAGIIGLMNKGQPRSLDDWGAMSAWSWGASRLLDYLETDPTVDAKHVGLMGHSRFGKTALVAMAYDSRFAVLYSSSSGEGGAKLYRHIYGEPLPNAASSTEYQWFDGNFLKYAGPLTPGDLPVDNHELIALCAPRPVFIGAGRSAGDGYADPRGDGWADARGMFLAEVAAGPVYQLLGKKGLGTTEYPPIETALVSGDLGFRQHSGGHTPAPNWPAFLDFASRYLNAAANQSAPPAQHTERPTPPTRDPHTAGYVTAAELPDGAVPSPDADGNFIIGPTHNPAAEASEQEGVPKGTVIEFTMNSSESKFYPGIMRDPGPLGTPDPVDPAKLVVTTSHAAPYTRKVAVYVPKQYVAGSAAPFIVGADGPDRLLFAALDNLIAEHKVPAMIAISIANGGGDAQGSERGLEYDTMSGRYAEFVEQEVLPRVEQEAHVKLTHDPDGRAATGNSSGGSCALAMAWYHPELYHRVLTYSGTFINQQWPSDPQMPHGAWEFHEHLIPSTARKPIRIWMEVGDRDLLNPNVMRDNMHDWVLANELMAKVLAVKGYHYQFVFARNAGHVDRGTRQQTLPEALEYLWQGYRPAKE